MPSKTFDASRAAAGSKAPRSASFLRSVRLAPFVVQLVMETVMELFSSAWLSALLAIVLIDLVLAGDNAIVIALAARNLPAHLQKKAIVWGTVGAVVVRTAMTIGVVWLLKIPGLLLVGGSADLGRLQAARAAGFRRRAASPRHHFLGCDEDHRCRRCADGCRQRARVAGAAHGAIDLWSSAC
jgi:hypothetical protein